MAEATPDSGAAIVKKTWAERQNDEPELESDADEQLLMYIPCVLSYFLYCLTFSPSLAIFALRGLPRDAPHLTVSAWLWDMTTQACRIQKRF